MLEKGVLSCDLAKSDLKQEIDNNLKTRLAAYGVIVDDVSLVDFAFSPEFSRAIEAKQIAEQEAIAGRIYCCESF